MTTQLMKGEAAMDEAMTTVRETFEIAGFRDVDLVLCVVGRSPRPSGDGDHEWAFVSPTPPRSSRSDLLAKVLHAAATEAEEATRG